VAKRGLDILVVDAATGRLRSAFPLDSEMIFPATPLMFVPQSDILLFGSSRGIRQTTITGSIKKRFDPTFMPVPPVETNSVATTLAQSADCRLIATTSRNGWLRVGEIASGKEIIQFKGRQDSTPGDNVIAVAFSSDGRYLAGGCSDNTIHIWDTVTFTECKQFRGHDGTIKALAFSPDGKVLASCAGDTTVLLWDIAELARVPQAFKPLAKGEFEKRWSELADLNPLKAHQAFHRLAEDPQETTAMIKIRFEPTEERKASIRRCITDLDQGAFKQRQAAIAELNTYSIAAVPLLEDALKSKLTSLEGKRRLEVLLKLLKPFQQYPLSGEDLRLLRTVTLLEHIGNPAALDILRPLAKRAPDPLLTSRTRVALHRLQQKQR
jgi:hypothetical protein